MNKDIIDAMADLDEEKLAQAIADTRESAGDAQEILASLQEGLRIVGQRFEENRYFLSELIMSSEIFKDTIAGLGLEAREEQETVGTFMIGTVAGDIHDIGKNIVASVMGTNGFRVIDLGVDVSTQDFIDAVRREDPQIIGLSCLLTTAFDSIKEVVDKLKAEDLVNNRLILIGGGPVDEHTVAYTGADKYCTDAQETIHVARRFLGV